MPGDGVVFCAFFGVVGGGVCARGGEVFEEEGPEGGSGGRGEAEPG